MSNSFNLRGRLTVNVLYCQNLQSVVMMGKMDPYVKVDCSGSEKFKTAVAQDTHANPIWNNSFIFNLVGKEDLIHLHVYHQATISDDMIGRLDLSLDQLHMDGKPHTYNLSNPSNFTKSAGQITISATFEGHGLPPGSVAATTHAARTAPPAATTPAAAAPAATTPAAAAPAATGPPPILGGAAPGIVGAAGIKGGIVAAAPAPAPAPAYPVSAPPAYPQQQQPAYGQQQQQQYPPQQQQGYPPQQQGYPQQQQPVYGQQPQQPQVVYAQQPQQPQVVYAQQPQVVYAQPQPQVVYAQPQPQVIYQAPAPQVVYQQPAQPYVYGQQPTYQPQQQYYR